MKKVWQGVKYFELENLVMAEKKHLRNGKDEVLEVFIERENKEVRALCKKIYVNQSKEKRKHRQGGK